MQVKCRILGWAAGSSAAAALSAVLLWTVLLGGAGSAARADEMAPGGGEAVTADALYNLAKFTRWPAHAFASVDAPLRLCVLGADPFSEALAAIDGRRVGNRNLRARMIARMSDIPDCHLLFVSASEQDRLAAVLAATDGAAVLTVAEIPGFARAGGVIALESAGAGSRFNVNTAAAGRAGLKLSAKLLRLAASVIQE